MKKNFLITVSVFAYGAGAEAFGCVMKNTDIPKNIEALMRPGA